MSADEGQGTSPLDELAMLYPELDRLHGLLSQIALLHVRRVDEAATPQAECQECGSTWPCPTLQLVRLSGVADLSVPAKMSGLPGHFEDCPRYIHSDPYAADWCDCAQRRAAAALPPVPLGGELVQPAHELLEQDDSGAWWCSCGASGVEMHEPWTEHLPEHSPTQELS